MKRRTFIPFSDCAVVLVVGYFMEGKWAIRHETLTLHNPARNGRPVAKRPSFERAVPLVNALSPRAVSVACSEVAPRCCGAPSRSCNHEPTCFRIATFYRLDLSFSRPLLFHVHFRNGHPVVAFVFRSDRARHRLAHKGRNLALRGVRPCAQKLPDLIQCGSISIQTCPLCRGAGDRNQQTIWRSCFGGASRLMRSLSASETAAQ